MGSRNPEALTHLLRVKTVYVPFIITASYFGKQQKRRSYLSYGYGATSSIGMVGKDNNDAVTVMSYGAQVLKVGAKAGTPGARANHLQVGT